MVLIMMKQIKDDATAQAWLVGWNHDESSLMTMILNGDINLGKTSENTHKF